MKTLLKIVFAYVSEHCSYFWGKRWSRLEVEGRVGGGGVCKSLSWTEPRNCLRAEKMKHLNLESEKVI